MLNRGVATSIILPVSEGSFTVDRNSAQRRSGQIVVEILPEVPPQTVAVNGEQVPFLPLTPASPLAPFGTEVLVELAVMQAGEPIGKWGWVPLGVYAIAETVITDSGVDLSCQLNLFDRSWQFSRWALQQNYSVPAADGTLQGEVTALLSYIWNQNGPGRSSAGGLPVPAYISHPNFALADWVCPPGTFQQGEDPWAACLQMAASAGFELFFDVQGLLTGKPIPGTAAGGSLSSLPVVWNFVPGEVSAIGTFNHALAGTPYTTPAGVVLTMTQEHLTNDAYVTATGPNNAQSGDTPIQARASDTNPQSPTYINGPIGDIPSFTWDPNLNSLGQAQAEAAFNLATSISEAWTAAITTPLNPLFDIDDVITITQPRLGLETQKVIIDTISVSIRYDEQTSLSGRLVLPGS